MDLKDMILVMENYKGKRHGELRFLKCCVGYVLQFMDRLLCQRTHSCVHIRQCVGNRRNRSAAVVLVVNADG